MPFLLDIIFYGTISCELSLIILFLFSLRYPERRVWPPGRFSFSFFMVWTLSILSIAGIVALAVLSWGTYVFNHWIYWIIGAALFIGGNLLAVWGILELSSKASLGLKHRLVTSGPYKYTRNPQYLGDIIALIGAFLLSNSFYVLVTSILGIIIFIIMPFIEEPWLREVYGEEYINYCRRVPRFIGIPRPRD